jgi:hypothetical protein
MMRHTYDLGGSIFDVAVPKAVVAWASTSISLKNIAVTLVDLFK